MTEESILGQEIEIVEDNIGCLNQGTDLVKGLDRGQFPDKISQCFNSSPGGHLGHIIEHFKSLLIGLGEDQGTTAKMDYDVRKRDPEIEQNPIVLVREIEELSTRLQALAGKLALVATMKAIAGIRTPEEFGIARSTLAHRGRMSA